MDKLEIVATAYDTENSCEYIKFNDKYKVTYRKTIDGIKNASSIVKIKGGYAIAEEDTNTGKLYLLDDNFNIKECIETGVKGIVYLNYNQKENILFGGGYTDGKIFVLKNWQLKVYSKSGENSSIHCIKYENNRFYVVNCGEDTLYIYNNKFEFCDKIAFPENSKPRHIIFNKNNAYVICENSNEVYLFDIEPKGLLKFVERYKTYDGAKESYASTLLIKNNRLYALNRGADLITSFVIQDDGKLMFDRQIPAYGEYPWEIKTLNDDFFIANKKSGEISIVDGNYSLVEKIKKQGVNNILTL
ncbi:MAG: beta-propeller fold lactonase family protein [Clostridia bacterium]|nr:beta-propeller fold lactonase family protein [Clostridia bacterium]